MGDKTPVMFYHELKVKYILSCCHCTAVWCRMIAFTTPNKKQRTNQQTLTNDNDDELTYGFKWFRFFFRVVFFLSSFLLLLQNGTHKFLNHLRRTNQ